MSDLIKFTINTLNLQMFQPYLHVPVPLVIPVNAQWVSSDHVSHQLSLQGSITRLTVLTVLPTSSRPGVASRVWCAVSALTCVAKRASGLKASPTFSAAAVCQVSLNCIGHLAMHLGSPARSGVPSRPSPALQKEPVKLNGCSNISCSSSY